LEEAARLRAKDPAIWNELGLTRQKQGDYRGAAEAYKRAVDLEPANLDARNNLGLALANSRQAELALVQFHKVLEIDPTNETAQVNIGFTYLLRAELDKAVAQFLAIIVQRPTLAIAHYDLGLALKKKDDIKDERGELQRARADPPCRGALHA
jgi:Flp pilus assembly protein TadD